MLLCAEQKNPIKYRGKKIALPEDLLNMDYLIYGCPVAEPEIDFILSCATDFRQDRQAIIDEMSSEQLSMIVLEEKQKELRHVIEWGISTAMEKEK